LELYERDQGRREHYNFLVGDVVEFLDLKLGDCLERMKEIPDGSIDMVLCDLPYGTTACKWDTVIPFEPLWVQYRRVAKPNAAIVLTAGQPFTSALVMSNIAMFKYAWVWRKEAGTGLLNAKKQPLRDAEDVLVFYKSQPVYNPQWASGKPYKCKKGGETDCYGKSGIVVTESDGRRYPKTVIEFQRDTNKVHPTQKPVALMEYLIRTYTNEGDIVLDNCMGSGTTGVATIRNNRKFIGIEKEPTYFEIAKNRIYSELF
jgi:hypothetical protein